MTDAPEKKVEETAADASKRVHTYPLIRVSANFKLEDSLLF